MPYKDPERQKEYQKRYQKMRTQKAREERQTDKLEKTDNLLNELVSLIHTNEVIRFAEIMQELTE